MPFFPNATPFRPASPPTPFDSPNSQPNASTSIPPISSSTALTRLRSQGPQQHLGPHKPTPTSRPPTSPTVTLPTKNSSMSVLLPSWINWVLSPCLANASTAMTTTIPPSANSASGCSIRGC